ncbi:MAG: hypothetical protein AAGH19_10255 [Pseudomonadota bacterium]
MPINRHAQPETDRMETLFNTLVLFHIAVGSIGLTSFWVPVVARKRRGLHTQAGKVFAYAMLATALSAALAALLTLLAPLATHPEISSRYANNLRAVNGLMLLYLAAITFAAAFTGLKAARLKRRWGAHRERLETAIHGSAFVLAIAVLLVGWQRGSWLMMGLSLIGLLGTPGTLRRILNRPNQGMEWKYQHMGAMLAAGIAAHTAFLVFGAGRFVDSSLGNSIWVWLAPTLIGVPAIALWTRIHRRRDAGINDHLRRQAAPLEVQP